MNSRFKPELTLRTLTLLLLIALFASFWLYMAGHSTAQSPIAMERRLRNQVPGHLPLSFKVNKLNNEKWLDDLEIEVRNLSDKPIYFLEFFLEMPEIRDDRGVPFGFPLRYGRIQLVSYVAPLEPTDVPIKPGETYIYKVDPDQIGGWEKYKSSNGKHDPKRVDLIFVQLNFGDGTGFDLTNGTPKDIRKSSNNATPKSKPTTLSELFPARTYN